MRSIVVYASRYGNTRQIAEVIADRLRERGGVQLLPAEEAPVTVPAEVDLVVGGPTEAHRMTEPVASFLDDMAPGALRGRSAAAFDTRVRWPRWLSGSAAAGISYRLRRAGARVIAPAESFFVTRRTAPDGAPVLEPGELERAAAWAGALADASEATASAPRS